MLFNIRPVRNIDEIKQEVIKIVEKQKPGSQDDMRPFRKEIDDLLASFSEFRPEWKKAPAVFRIARIENQSGIEAFLDNVALPDVKHDLDLIKNMMNHKRGEKGLDPVKMPLFIQPDEISYVQGKFDSNEKIRSQLAIIFQKGAIMWVGFVFGKEYTLLQN